MKSLPTRVLRSSASRVRQHFHRIIATLFMVVVAGTAAAEKDDYRLHAGDQVQIIVFGEAELSGDFNVDAAGTIHYPLVGRLYAAGRSLPELEQDVTNLLSDGVLRNPSVFVRLIAARPIHVLGHVREPGTYPYFVGGIIKTAVAQAGGFGTANAEFTDTISDFLTADQRANDLAAERSGLEVTIARIEAQLDGKSDFIAGHMLDQNRTSSMAVLIEAEKRLFTEQNEMLEEEILLIQSRRPVLLSELRSIDQQIKTEQQSVDLVQQRIDELSILADRGLARNNSIIDLQLIQSTKASNVWRLEAEKSRLDARITALVIQITEFENDHRRRLLTELAVAKRRMLSIDTILPSLESVREARHLALKPQVSDSSAYVLTVTRLVDGEVRVFAGSYNDILEPGDIVEVLHDSNAISGQSGFEALTRLPGLKALERSGTNLARFGMTGSIDADHRP